MQGLSIVVAMMTMKTFSTAFAPAVLSPHKSFFTQLLSKGNSGAFKTCAVSFPSQFHHKNNNIVRFMSTDNDNLSLIAPTEINISRLATLQSLLQKAGAPGSSTCNIPNDLEPVSEHNLKLHPHLYPIAKSTSNPEHYICGLRRAYADDALYESSTNAPWPIVESKVGGMGYNLLSLNSEHMMRRIASQADSDRDEGKAESSTVDELIDLYNQDLGQGALAETALDVSYERGSVTKLGYGASKYVLLRVGPFPDLYEEMSTNHAARGDEASSIIAAEASNGKFTGFGSTFRFYAQLLNSLPQRADESKDAARVCLRLPLPSIGINDEDFVRVSVLAGLLDGDKEEEDVELAEAMSKLEEMYEKIKTHEEDDEQSRANMTQEQVAIEDANKILDRMVFQSEVDWSSLRKELGDIYSNAGLDEMATFVDPNRS